MCIENFEKLPHCYYKGVEYIVWQDDETSRVAFTEIPRIGNKLANITIMTEKQIKKTGVPKPCGSRRSRRFMRCMILMHGFSNYARVGQLWVKAVFGEEFGSIGTLVFHLYSRFSFRNSLGKPGTDT